MRMLSLGPHIKEIARDPLIGGPQRIVFVIGCAAKKRPTRSPARELYTSPLFRKSLELASLIADAAYVASAKHGLVELDEELEPYEETLVGKPKAERLAWGCNVGNALEARLLGGVARPRVVILAGEPYSAPIIAALASRPRFLPPIDLLLGMQIGERLSFLNRAIALVKGER